MTQSALGTGAGYVALLLIAYERFHSPWAISIVLIADLVAPMLFGPVFGAIADRWSRRSCAVVADVVRAVAFIGVALVHGFAPTVAFALLAGVGTALFTPATLAALPSLVTKERLPAATSLYGAIADVGLAAGPALAALVLVAGGPEEVLLANAVTFVISAFGLLTINFGRAPTQEAGEHLSLFADTRAGMRASASIPGLSTVLLATGAALFFGGLLNVAELPFVTTDLGGSRGGLLVRGRPGGPRGGGRVAVGRGGRRSQAPPGPLPLRHDRDGRGLRGVRARRPLGDPAGHVRGRGDGHQDEADHSPSTTTADQGPAQQQTTGDPANGCIDVWTHGEEPASEDAPRGGQRALVSRPRQAHPDEVEHHGAPQIQVMVRCESSSPARAMADAETRPRTPYRYGTPSRSQVWVSTNSPESNMRVATQIRRPEQE